MHLIALRHPDATITFIYRPTSGLGNHCPIQLSYGDVAGGQHPVPTASPFRGPPAAWMGPAYHPVRRRRPPVSGGWKMGVALARILLMRMLAAVGDAGQI